MGGEGVPQFGANCAERPVTHGPKVDLDGVEEKCVGGAEGAGLGFEGD